MLRDWEHSTQHGERKAVLTHYNFLYCLKCKIQTYKEKYHQLSSILKWQHSYGKYTLQATHKTNSTDTCMM